MTFNYSVYMTLLGVVMSIPGAAQTLVVGNKNADTAGFVDLDSGEMRVERATGPGPHEVAVSPDGRIAAVVAYGSAEEPGKTIGLFDVASATAIGMIDLGAHNRPHGIVWLPDSRHLAATVQGSGHLLVVDSETREIVKAVATGAQGSHMVALSPDGGRAYVANVGGDSFSVIDIAAGERVAVVPAGRESEGIAVTPDGGEIWVANRGADSVFVYDAESFERIAEIGTGRVPIRVAVSPDGRTVAVSNAGEGSVELIDRAGRTVTRSLRFAGESGSPAMPVTLLFSPDGERLFVALTAIATVAEIDTANWQTLKLIAAGAGSDGLGWSPLSLDPAR